MALQRHLCEHAFVGGRDHPVLCSGGVGRGNVIAAESAAWEMQSKTGKPIPLDFALALTHLYGEKADGRYELAALRYLSRYINEAKPSSWTSPGSPLSWRRESRAEASRSSVIVVRCPNFRREHPGQYGTSPP